MIRGSCLGWSIDSDHGFHFLRDAPAHRILRVGEWEPGTDPAAAGELLVRWRHRPGRPFHGSVHRMPEGHLVIETSDAGWFRLKPGEGRVDMPIDADPIAREVRLLTTPMLLLATEYGFTPLHASCVAIAGRAVAIAAPGGFGKTTLAAHLTDRGHDLLAEDVTLLEESGDVLPGPDLLRLRPDALDRLASSRLEVVARTESRVMVRTGSRLGEPVQLHAVVLLKASEREQLVERTDAQRLADLWQVSFHLPNLTDRRRAFSSLVTLADRVRIYDLDRPLHWSSMEFAMNAIEGLVP